MSGTKGNSEVESFNRVKKSMNMTPFLVIVFLYMFMMMGTRPSIPLLASELGSTSFQIGMIVSSFALVPLFFSIHFGKWIDHLHAKTTLLWGGYVGVIGIGLLGFSTNLTGVYLSQLIGGLTSTVFMLSSQNYIARISHPDQLHHNVGWYSISIALGSVVGPIFCGFIADHWDFARVFQVNSGIGLLAVLAIHFLKDEPPRVIKDLVNGESKGKKSFIDLLCSREIQFALLMSALILFTKDIFTSFFPLLAKQMGYSNTVIGVLLSIHGMATVISRLFMAKLVDQLGIQKLFKWSVICSSLSLFLLPISQPFTMSVVNVGILGLVLGMGLPLSMSLTMSSTPHERVGEALGVRLTVNRLTQCITPFIFGMFSSLFGISFLFYSSSLVVLLGVIFIFRRLVSNEKPKALSK